MKVAVPAETKNNEFRVAITPAGVHELARAGHEVFVEAGAGEGSSLSDDAFAAAGATIMRSADDVWGTGDLVLKVKEPVPEEYHRMRPGQVLFTYLHLAASKECTDALLDRRVTAIAYETVQLTRPSSWGTARCPCWRRCPRSPGGWRRRSARTTCSGTAAGEGC